MIPIIYPYKMGSASARALATALSTKRVRPDGRFRPRNNHLIINWGSSHIPSWPVHDDLWLNHCQDVIVASNKLQTFQCLQEHEVSIPEFTTDPTIANTWVGEGFMVLQRNSLAGHSGAGIQIVGGDYTGVLTHAPLYVKYIKKAAEYRVHVFRGQVIDIQQKMRRDGWRDNPSYSTVVRSHDNGWVYTREGITTPDDVVQQSVAAVAALDLDFGAVDVIWNNHYNRAYVLEVNTAPGLEGHTIEVYANAIRGLL